MYPDEKVLSTPNGDTENDFVCKCNATVNYIFLTYQEWDLFSKLFIMNIIINIIIFSAIFYQYFYWYSDTQSIVHDYNRNTFY